MKRIDLDAATVGELKTLLGRYRSYKAFRADRKAAFRFVSLVGTRICPYCNINHTYTVTARRGKLILRPDIDHFEAQSNARKKTMQYDNLVPSCQQCNSRLKLARKFSAATHINPYKDSFDDIKLLSLSLENVSYLKEEGFRIVFRRRPSASLADDRRANANIHAFRLRERYAMHKPEVLDLLDKLKFYHSLRLEEIMRLSRSDVPFELALFGPPITDINAVSLGKLKRDLIREYR